MQMPIHMPSMSSMMPHTQEMITDHDALDDKKKILGNQWLNEVLHSMATPITYIAGILTTVGVTMTVKPFAGALTEAIKASGAGVSGVFDSAIIGEAFAAAGADYVGLAILGAGAVAIAAATVANYMAAHIHHSTTFDNLETQARHMAKYFGQEMAKQKEGDMGTDKSAHHHVVNSTLADKEQEQPYYAQNERSDGKSWQDYTSHRNQQHAQGR